MKNVFKRLLLIVSSIVVMSVINSCGGNSINEDAEALLKTVPGESSVVMVIDAESLMAKTGVEYKDNKFVVTPQIDSLLDEQARAMLNAQLGIKPTVFIGFLYRNTFVLTGRVEDKEMLNKFLTDKANDGQTIAESLGADSKIVISDNQFWLASDHNLSAEAIMDWEHLKEKESAYVSNQLVAEMSKLEKDIQFVYDVDRMMSSVDGVDIEQKMMLNMIKEMFVKDFAFTAGWVDFGKDEILSEIRNYNSKYGPAEYVFDAQKIDTSLLKELPKNCDFVCAYGTTSKMWLTLCNAVSQFVGNMMDSSQKIILERVLDAVKGLDGTIIVGFESNKMKENPTKGNLVAIVQTKDEAATRSLLTLVETIMPTLPEGMSLKADGKMLKFTMGNIAEYGMTELDDKLSGNLTTVYVDGDFFATMLSEVNFVESLNISADSMDHGVMSIKIKENSSENVIKALIDIALKHKSTKSEPEPGIIY